MRNILEGERIRLTSVKDEDLAWIESWFNDTNFLRFYDIMPAIPASANDIKSLIEDFRGSNEKYIFSIRFKETNQIVGVIGFDEIVWSSGVATVFIGIGDEDYLGRGLGKEALNLLLDFGFNEFNFHRIQLNVIAYNESAIKTYEGAGFKKEGIFREFVFRDGKRFDLYLYGMLKREWKTSCLE